MIYVSLMTWWLRLAQCQNCSVRFGQYSQRRGLLSSFDAAANFANGKLLAMRQSPVCVCYSRGS